MSLFNDVAITAFLKSQLFIVADRENGVLLDLGCGQQPYRAIYDGLFRRVVVADIDIRSRIDVRLNVHQLPFRNKSFDVVLLTEVVEHVEDATSVFREVCRILKSGGHVFLTWPFLQPLHELPRDYVRYTEFGMQRLLEREGLQMEVLHRRGDLACVALAVLEECLMNGLELLARLPWIGRFVFRPMTLVMRECIRFMWEMHVRLIGKANRFHPQVAGDRLRGPMQQPALWTMGYCARIMKVNGC